MIGSYNPLTDPLNLPQDYLTLSAAQRDTLSAFIRHAFRPAVRVLQAQTSYGLKHLFERSPGGYYLTNGQFKGAMRAAGHKPVDERALNWEFRITVVKAAREGVKGSDR